MAIMALPNALVAEVATVHCEAAAMDNLPSKVAAMAATEEVNVPLEVVVLVAMAFPVFLVEKISTWSTSMMFAHQLQKILALYAMARMVYLSAGVAMLLSLVISSRRPSALLLTRHGRPMIVDVVRMNVLNNLTLRTFRVTPMIKLLLTLEVESAMVTILT